MLQFGEARLGFRSSRLVMFGSIWVLLGISTMTQPFPAHPASALILHEQIPAVLHGAAWIATGGIAMTIGLRRAHDDSLGWAALTVLPTVRLLSWGFAWAAWLVSSALHALAPLVGLSVPVVGFSGGITGGLVYLVILSLVSSSARHRCAESVLLPLPPDLPPRPEEDR